MEWQELKQKFETLNMFFSWEYRRIPSKIMERLWDENMGVLVVPVSCETKSGEKVSAELQTRLGSGQANLIILRKTKRKEWRESEKIYFLQFDCYEYFPIILKQGLSNYQNYQEELCPFDQSLVAAALVRAYHDLRRAIENFFIRANKMCSEDQRELWLLARQEAHAKDRLREIVQICEASRSTVGKSKTLKAIREKAKMTMRIGQYGQYAPDRFIPVLPAE